MERISSEALTTKESAADWAEQLARGELGAIRRSFARQGARGPEIVWHPSIDLLGSAALRFLLAHWSRLAGPQGLARADRIDPMELRQALGLLSLVDVIDDGRDFRYRLYGSTIAAVSEFDMTGQSLSAMPVSPYIKAFALAAYRASLARQAPLFTEHSPPAAVSHTVWQRLILPLVDEAGEIVRFISGNVPVPRDGRFVMPHL